jgi:hypothetical protein
MIEARDCQSISANLKELGFFVDQAHGNSLNVIRTGANKGLWITLFEKNWYVNTYMQIAYQVPLAQDIERLCAECLNAEKFVNVTIPDYLVEKFSLRLLQLEEFEKLGM